MTAKFKVGDKVVVKRLNKRTPLYIREAIRISTKRTVRGVYYDKGTHHNRYYLGGNNKRDMPFTAYPFRAEQLKGYEKKNRGRPRQRRGYARRVV